MSLRLYRAMLTIAVLTLLPAVHASLPPCKFGDEPALLPPGGEWKNALVDTYFRLPADFVPPDLVPVRAAGVDDDRMLRASAAFDLAALVAAAAADGVRLELQSAYRSFAYQQRVFAGWVDALGPEAARRVSARPGHSEHQLGTAIDLRTAGGPAPWELHDWGTTREGSWLRENAWRFGFVMSYPRGASEISCYDYEPWHYRWLGRDTAARVDASGLTLREWLWRQLPAGGESP